MFLTHGLEQKKQDDVGLLFEECRGKYTKIYHSRGDWPCFFGRRGKNTYNTNDRPNEPIPRGVFSKGATKWIGKL